MTFTDAPFETFTLQDFMAAIHCGNVALWSWDPSKEIAHLDPLAQQFWGVSDRTLPLDMLWARIHSTHRSQTIKAWRSSAQAEAPYEFSFPINQPGAETRWIAARGTGASGVNHDGPIPAIFVDVTQDVAQRNHQVMLLREMGHRVSNLFAVTKGIVALTKPKHTALDTFTDELGQRLSQLSNAYRVVMRDPTLPIDRMDIAQAIDLLLAPYGIAQHQLRLNIDDGPVIGDQALTSLALILHELVTNAMKHGAFSAPGGQLTVDFKRISNAFNLIWTETNAAQTFKARHPPSGLGLQLIRRTAQMAFGAEVNLHVLEAGLVLAMVIPADRLEG